MSTARRLTVLSGAVLLAASMVGCGSGGVTLPSDRPSVALPTASLSLPSRSPGASESETPTPTPTPTPTRTRTQSPSATETESEPPESESETPTPTESESETPTPTPTDSESETPTPTPTPTPTASSSPPIVGSQAGQPTEESGTSPWIWVLLALLIVAAVVAAVLMARRRRDVLVLAESRGAWRQSASEQVPAVRALAAEIAALRIAPDATAEDAGAMRQRAETVATQVDSLAGAAVTPEDASTATETAAALRAFALAAQGEVLQRDSATPPTAEALSAADAASRRAQAELDACLSVLESGPAEPAPPSG